MKLVSFLARLAALGFSTFVLSVALDVRPLACFAFAVSALFLLIVAGDYAPRPLLRGRTPGRVISFPPFPAANARSAEKLAA